MTVSLTNSSANSSADSCANTLADGFDDPVFAAQAVFRNVLAALARPGLARPLVAALTPPTPLTPELAAVALALADSDAPLWLDAPLAAQPAVAAYLRFHTGAPITADPAKAAFALIADPARLLPFTDFAQGTDEYPDRSTTLVIATERLNAGPSFRLAGPGIRGDVAFGAAGLPRDIAARLAANNALFPRGVDLVIVAPGHVAGVPRSSRVLETA